RIFRVDNPHTKPFNFWEWLISEIKMGHPDVIFLSEAFTRPKVMYRLAKLGFSQSYTYFTWRNTKQELMSYVDELTHGGVREYLRPNFWPNTPDILPEFLQLGGRNAFIIRLVLAATLSSNYGIYGPPYELCENNAMPGSEEYLNSEKYEIRNWNLDSEEGLGDLITRINRIRKDNPALQDTYNTAFLEINNDKLIAYSKATRDLLNVLIVVVNLDPFHTQSGQITVPTEELGIDPEKPYLVHDLLGEEKYLWQGRLNSIELSPSIMPAYIFRIRKLVRKEANFDYYM
ncbi:MAG: alpha-1,4-glucan--maltose-1-phosphate maltosyltransferase, partial [Candidatus Methanosuratus sp.]|nr:alpha-1,4-glucan--maltose-1-phosphate maltosyltransferase [Candidatus Methanosuratincola sp.]